VKIREHPNPQREIAVHGILAGPCEALSRGEGSRRAIEAVGQHPDADSRSVDSKLSASQVAAQGAIALVTVRPARVAASTGLMNLSPVVAATSLSAATGTRPVTA